MGAREVNFYPFHIGDYTADTRHLSILEDGAYRRLLDLYYTREAPLPSALGEIQRLVAARDRVEKKAVETVLHEFFKLTDAGWSHERCDKEIAVAASKRTKAAQSARTRWGNAPDMRTHPPSTPDRNANALPTQCEGNAPIPNPIPNIPPNPPAGGAAADKPPGGNPPRRSGAWRASEAGIRAKALEVGIGEAKPGEDWQAYIRRVADAAESRSRQAA